MSETNHGRVAGLIAALLLAPLPLLAGVAAGQPAPALVAQTLDGGTFNLAALHGHVVLVNFWATWCTPCRQEIPALKAFYHEHHERGLELIGVSTDRARDAGQVRKMLAEIGYPVAMVSAASENGFGQQRALPVTFVIDRQGVVRAEMRPDSLPVTAESLARTVLPLLAER
ncbi:MAG: TlpA family protein disulfide reductase [Acidobacteria bacterium]|nr:TlpA family protein disulfide reductase [Acidobacteriota bacterium]